MKVVNIDEENLHVFRKTWGISIKVSEKYVSYDNIKIHKKQGVTPYIENKVLEKPQGWSHWNP